MSQFRRCRPTRGIVLVFAAGILTILAAIGTAFYTLTRASTVSAVRYSDMVRADLLARAGLNEAVTRLRMQAYLKIEDPSDPWFQTDYMNQLQQRISFACRDAATDPFQPYSRAMGSTVTENGDRFILQVTDAASRININAGDNLGVILDNLCRVIGPPLVAANQDALQPRRWAVEGATPGLYDNALNAEDTDGQLDLHGRLGGDGRPVIDANGVALYGDGYAIAAYRSRNGRFGSSSDVRDALTYVERNGNRQADDPLEQLEIESKFAAIRNYITTDSWVDTTTVGVGKFEWVSNQSLSKLCHARLRGVYAMRSAGTDTDPATGQTANVYDFQGISTDDNDYQVLIDRDKSWIADDPIGDPMNTRGSLRGAYVSIMNGHGAGQLRRIATNGTDWIAIHAYDPDESMTVSPGPISSYLIMGREDAKVELVPGTVGTYLPRVRRNGSISDDPSVDYEHHPLCIHRAPVNINTASDKVLAALFMGINVQHGHPMAVGTAERDGASLGSGVDKSKLVPTQLKNPPLAFNTTTDWKTKEYANRNLESCLLTLRGLKRIPADDGKLVFNRPRPAEAVSPQYDYLDSHGTQLALNEAQELAFRVIHCRQKTDGAGNALGNDPLTNYPRGPFNSWDDLYFRVVKPWDDKRITDGWQDLNGNGTMDGGDEYHIVSRARMILANANNNTDILKFNPNIEWIDRYGRNFTEMEPVMVFDAGANQPKWVNCPLPVTAATDAYHNYTAVAKYNYQSGSYYTRSLRYKSDDLVDKTDLNRSTTEFSFNSGGIYEVVSTGQTMGPCGLLSERKLEALVKVYDVWRESTQDQFVRGHISAAENATGLVTDPNRSGRVVRDARNTTAPFKRLALETWPEALVPLGYTLAGTALVDDLVSIQHFDAWQQQKTARGTPDVVANRVLPSRFDGQIALATNTSRYDTGVNDTFLASFNGDLDTETCASNGRECAKTPCNYKTRVVDTIGLLGVLNDPATNDENVDLDPKGTWQAGKPDYDVFPVSAANAAMQALNKTNYWENVTCRMGDLRPEGVFLGNVGISGKDATLKYQAQGNWPFGWSPSNQAQLLVRMWMKPTWHVKDGQEHEFFNGCNTGDSSSANSCRFAKMGKLSDSRRPGADLSARGGGFRQENLYLHIEDRADSDVVISLHGGLWAWDVDGPTRYPESPSFRTQPFRWHYTGYAANFNYSLPSAPATNERGRWGVGGSTDAQNANVVGYRARTFIDTQRDPIGPNWGKWYQTKVGTQALSYPRVGNNAAQAQRAAWDWAQRPAITQADKSVFSLNNLNGDTNKWLYRASPIDGTQAVVDELKISCTRVALQNDVWPDKRVETEMTTSRYYLPADPSSLYTCPTFTSQTLLQSVRGTAAQSTSEDITVVRVAWNCFTPRFMFEFKNVQTDRRRMEAVGDTGGENSLVAMPYRGPFDYIQYNLEILETGGTANEGEANWNPAYQFPAGSNVYPLCCDRPAPRDYPADAATSLHQSHATRGLQVELLRDPDGTPDSGDETILDGKTFTNPDAINALGTTALPVMVRPHELRYRVRFLYPIDHFVQQIHGTGNWLDPARHFMVDTPVFDDISVMYFAKTRTLSYREMTE